MWTKINIMSAVSIFNELFRLEMLIISLFTNIDSRIEYGPTIYA